MSSFCKCKSYSHFFGKNISVYNIFDDKSFNNMLTNDIVSFEQLGPECFLWIPVVLYEEVIIVYMVYGLPDLVPSV